MNTCPCCSTPLLRHARHNGVYLFCTHCWQEMPDLDSIVQDRHQRVQRLERLVSISSVSVLNKSVVNKKDTMTHHSHTLMNVV
ncbi:MULTISPECIES: hypothetical protein [Planktothricoides]|uniref:Uncharacterized protein n=2 Tax=Planktothricoides raciborskii TaxID=132608 RepID=A0AAU8JLL9_9CYAN|nr:MULTISPECIES: hypothetical protein [Planktothricoides]MBD2545399.1 hypothetical protein [Planktothricoides raciborskii FACHB-1370]MBD2583176.1 hypothetical protein [Planktothricoides raciborskii FACHB-1261]